MKWIYKVTSQNKPNECCVWYGAIQHKYPETQFTFFIKGRYKKYSENPEKRLYRPYFPLVESGMIEVAIIGKTALDNDDELVTYCNTLTTILNNRYNEPKNELPQNIPAQVVC
jgi:hypothetical protein